MSTATEYTGGYTVLGVQEFKPERPVLGHYSTLAQACAAAKKTHGAVVIRTVGAGYDVTGAKRVSMLIQRCGVMTDGRTFLLPA